MVLKRFQSIWLCVMGAAALSGAACAGDDEPSGGGTDGDTEGTGGTATTGSSESATSTTSPGSATAATSSGTGMDDGGFVDPDTGDTGPMGPQPNGGMCTSDDECESGFCYTVPQLGGVCSECLQDSDCRMGTCSLDVGLGYAVCTDGSLGAMCDSDEGCMGDLVCSELIDTGGIYPANFCSECGEQTPCTGDQICTPFYDAGAFSGYLTCADPESVPDGQGCPLVGGTGDDTVCANGHCGVADVMGFVELGICGECSTDMDCQGQDVCTPASADMNGLMGATCGPP